MWSCNNGWPTLWSTELLSWHECSAKCEKFLIVCVRVCLQAQGRRPLSGCWLEDSDLTEEVSESHTLRLVCFKMCENCQTCPRTDPSLSLSQVRFPSWTSATSLKPSAPSLRFVEPVSTLSTDSFQYETTSGASLILRTAVWNPDDLESNTRFIWSCKVLFFFYRWIKCVSLFVCAGQRQSSAAREDQRRLHSPSVHHRRHEADADREHHRPGCKKHFLC